MARERIPTTPAIRFLKAQGVAFTVHTYAYEERGGTRVTARELGLDEYRVIKTLVMEDDKRQPLIVLMHGNRQVSTKSLARILGVKAVTPCDPAAAEKHTGYKVGGTSPFGTRKPLRVFLEETIASLPEVHINAGGRGLMASLAPAELVRVLRPTLVRVAL